MTGYGGYWGDDVWEICPECLVRYRAPDGCERCAEIPDLLDYNPWDDVDEMEKNNDG